MPGEEEQYEYYRQIIVNSPNQTITIRTLDLGGDKTVPYLGRRSEPNPFMGWRSTRIFFENSKLFVTQIRAILRASRHGHVSMLFPMITTLDEVVYLHKLGRDPRQSPRRGSSSARRQDGVMVRSRRPLPASTRSSARLISSRSANDLIRHSWRRIVDNTVAHLCEPLNPAIFRVRWCWRLASGPAPP